MTCLLMKYKGSAIVGSHLLLRELHYLSVLKECYQFLKVNEKLYNQGIVSLCFTGGMMNERWNYNVGSDFMLH